PKTEPAKTEPPKAEPPKQEPAKAQELDYEKLAQTMLGAVEKRTDHASKAVIKSMAEQYNLTEDEATELFESARDAKKAQLPPEKQEEVNKVLQMANDRLIAAEVKTASVELKIVDPDADLALMDKSNIKVDDKGNVTGVKEALDALTKAKPYLVGKASGGAWGDKQGGGAGDQTTARDEAKKQMFGG
ncbi:MAG: hypothetical protein ABFC56_16095, partial [Clostridiaceae bacterium]